MNPNVSLLIDYEVIGLVVILVLVGEIVMYADSIGHDWREDETSGLSNWWVLVIWQLWLGLAVILLVVGLWAFFTPTKKETP